MCSADDHPGRTRRPQKGMSEVARNARQASRFLDELVRDADDIDAGISLKAASHKAATGRLLLQTRARWMATCRPACRWARRITRFWALSWPLHLAPARAPGDFGVQRHQYAHQGRRAGLAAEDYFNDQVLEDTDLLYSGAREIDQGFWEKTAKPQILARRRQKLLPHEGPGCANLLLNEILARRRSAVCRPRAGARKNHHAGNPQRLQPQQAQRMGRDRAQPRAKLALNLSGMNRRIWVLVLPFLQRLNWATLPTRFQTLKHPSRPVSPPAAKTLLTRWRPVYSGHQRPGLASPAGRKKTTTAGLNPSLLLVVTPSGARSDGYKQVTSLLGIRHRAGSQVRNPEGFENSGRHCRATL